MASDLGVLAEFVSRSDDWEQIGGTDEQLLHIVLPVLQSVLPQVTALRLYQIDNQLLTLQSQSHSSDVTPLTTLPSAAAGDTVQSFPLLIATLPQPVLLLGEESAQFALELIGGHDADTIEADEQHVLGIVGARLNALLGKNAYQNEDAIMEMRQLYNLSSDLLAAQNGMDVLRGLRKHLVPTAYSLILVSLDWDRASQNLTSLFVDCRLRGDEEIIEHRELIYQLNETEIDKLKAEWDMQGERVDIIEDLSALLEKRPALQYSYDTGVRTSIVIPIFSDGFLWRQITITFHAAHRFDAALRRLLNAARAQISVVLHNIRLLESTRWQSTQLERIPRFSEAVQSTLDIENLLNIALFSFPQILSLDHIDIAFYDAARGVLRIVAWQQEDGEIHVDLDSDWLIDNTDTTLWHVWETRLPQHIPDVRRETNLRHHNRTDLRALMTLPLFARGSGQGIVEIGSTRPAAYNAIDGAVFQQLVSQLSIAIENAEAYTQSRKLAMTKVTVNEISAKLSQQRDMEQLLHVTLTELGRALGARKGQIRLQLNESSGVVP